MRVIPSAPEQTAADPMTADPGVGEGTVAAVGDGGPELPRSPVLRLDGFEGPLDLLLDLARAQKVDLARISILQLVEQYLAVVESARSIRLELAADWLVMAAWLAWLKSRLLLPPEDGPDEEAEDAAELLAARLEELARIGAAASWLAERPQLGRDIFARGAEESLVEIDRSALALDVPQLMRAYLSAIRRTARTRVYTPRTIRFWTVQDALTRLRKLLGNTPPGWSALDAFMPDLPTSADDTENTRVRRAALAGTLIAGLELAKSGSLELRQDEAFGRIMLRPQESEA